MDLDELLDKWQVLGPGEWVNAFGPDNWYAVTNDEGIKAYFCNEVDAYRWRLDMINRELNP